MQGHQHLILGTVAGIAGSANFGDRGAGLVFCIACMAGSLYPDVDLQTSKAGRAAGPVSAVINRIFGHRGFIHTPVNGILMYVIIATITGQIWPEYAYVLASGFTAGFFLHLLQDTMTKGGIMWFWPVKWKIHLTNLSSNSPVCYVITAVMAFLVVIVFAYLVPMAGVPVLI